MARAKLRKKEVVKKQNDQAGNLKHSGSAFDGRESGDHGGIPSNILSTISEKSLAQSTHRINSLVFPETTPASQRGRTFHPKKLRDVFSKVSTDNTAAVDKHMTQGKNVPLTSTPNGSEVVSYSVPPNIHDDGSASIAKTTGAEARKSVVTEQEKITEPSLNSGIDSHDYPRKQQQRTLNFYFYPVEDTKKWVKEEIAKPSPRKRVSTKKLRTPTTDEMTEVLLWGSPLRKKRTLRDLTDLEVAYTIFKRTAKEFRDCVHDRGIMKLIEKYEECVERSIVKKLQRIEDAKTIQEQIKKLEKENKALSLNLGSLTDRKIRLQNDLAKRRKVDQE